MLRLLAALFYRTRLAFSRRRTVLTRWHRSPAGRLIAAFVAGQALAAHAQVVPDGQTATTVAKTGATTQVTTATVAGRTGFNSFSQFNVGGQSTVNMVLPGQAVNLINIVRDERSQIDGTVNSIRDGAIGGNLYFLNPHGFLVGAGGRFNVGSLSLQTPTPGFVNAFFVNGQPDGSRTAQVFDGSAPINPGATIDLRGTVNAIGDVHLAAGTLLVGGQIFSGARFVGQAPDFSDVVNTRGLASSTAVEVRGGRILLTAEGDLSVSGTVSSPGTAGEAGGSITLRAGRDIDMQAAALLAARGEGERSNGGTIDVLAQHDARLAAGATLDASAGRSGDGGSIEFSARHTVTLDGGRLAVGAAAGRPGTVLIDPENIDANRFPDVDGNVTIAAADSITVHEGVLVSSRQVAAGASADDIANGQAESTGNSGDITMTAPVIDIRAGAKLVSFATGDYSAGNITLDATGGAGAHAVTIAGGAKLDAKAGNGTAGAISVRASAITITGATLAATHGDHASGSITLEATSAPAPSILGYRTGSASVTLDGATLAATDITATAKTVLKNEWLNGGADLQQSPPSAQDAILDLASDPGSSFLSTLTGANIVHSQVIAKSSVTLKGGTLTADGKVMLRADNETEAKAVKPEGPGSLPVGIGAMYMRNESTAEVTVTGGAAIHATDLEVRAHNDAGIDAQVQGSKDGTGAIAVGITKAVINTTATIAADTTLEISRDLSLGATSIGSFKNSVTATTREVNGQAVGSAAVAVSEATVHTTAELNASVVGQAHSVSVLAISHTKENTTTAEAKVTKPDDPVLEAAQIGDRKLEAQTPADGGKGLQDQVQAGKTLDPKIEPKGGSKWFALGGAVAYGHSSTTSSATIGEGATVKASDHVVVAAQTKAEQTGTQAQAEAQSEASKNDPQQPTAKLVVGAGVAIGDYTHDAEARVGAGATIAAPRIGIAADVTLPRKDTPIDALTDGEWNSWDAIARKLEVVTDTDKLKDPFEYVNGGASAEGSAENVGLAGAVSLQYYHGNAHAIVERNATLQLGPGGTKEPDGSWSLSFTLAPAEGSTKADESSFSFDRLAKVQASQDAELWFFTGKLGNLAAGKASLGGSYNLVTSEGGTYALLREGAKVLGGDAANPAAASEFGVSAETGDRLVGVAAGGGRGESFGLTGQVTRTFVERSTLAAIDNEAKVNAGQVSVHATQDIRSWAIGGAVSTAQTAAVGLGAAINEGRAQVRAAIADVDTELGGTSDPQLTAPGEVAAVQLEVHADAQGRLQTVALAGALAGPSSGPIDWLEKRFKSLMGGEDEKGDPQKGKADKVTESKPEEAKKDAKQDEAKPKFEFTLAGAGSAAVNLTAVDAQAEVVGAHVVQTGVDGATLALRAINSTNVVAASGAAALTTGKAANTTQVGVAGAVAVNVLSGGALARIADSIVTDADTVQVQALKAGEHLSLGVGLNVNAGATQSSWQGTGSVSVTLSTDETDAAGQPKDRVVAAVDGASIDFDASNAASALDVTAYNKAKLGTGAGALNAMGKNAVGGAVTYSELTNTTAARISGSDIVDAGTVDVSAQNAMQIAAGAAMASVTTAAGANALTGAVVINKVAGNTTAAIDGSTVRSSDATVRTRTVAVVAKDVASNATLDALISERSSGIDYEFNAASVRTLASNGESEAHEAANLDASPDANSIVAVAGNVAVATDGSSNNVGASVLYNRIRNTLSATVDDSHIALADAGSGLAVNASAKSNIFGLGFGIALAGRLNLSGSVGISEIDNTVTARVNNVNNGATDGNLPGLAIGAGDFSRIDTIVGQVSGSIKASAIGAAVGYAAIGNTVQAQLTDSTVRGSRSATVDADSDARIRTIAVAGSFGKDVAVAASVGLNFIDNATSASIAGSSIGQRAAATPGDRDQLRVEATDSSKIAALTGGLAGAGTGGIGFAFSLNKIGSYDATATGHSISATISDSTISDADDATVRAASSAGIDSIGAALSGAGSFGISGSFAINNIAARTSAGLSGGHVSGNDTALAISALDGSSDGSRIRSISGGAAGAGSTAIGAGMAFNRIANTTDAWVNGMGSGFTDPVHRVKSLTVTASSLQTIDAATVGVAVGGDAGIGASVAVNLAGGNVTARIDGGAQVVAQDNVGVIADSDETITNIAGSAGIGAAGVGASVSVNRLSGTTEAKIDGGTTRVSAQAGSELGVQVAQGALSAGTVQLDGSADERWKAITDFGDADLKGRQQTERVTGVAVNASATHTIEAASGNVAAGLGGVGGVANVNVIGGATRALVSDATINGEAGAHARQQLSVKASDHALANGVLGNVAAGGGGIGITADVSAFARETSARVGNAALNAQGTAAIEAHSTQTAASFAAGGAFGAAGFAGTASVAKFTSTTEAALSGGTVSVGALDIDAHHTSHVLQTAAGLGAGGTVAGIGAAVALDTSTTRAKIEGGARVDATGAVTVDAATRTEVDALALAGAIGGVGFAGNAAVVVTNNTTEAQVVGSHIGTDARKASGLTVHATDSVTIKEVGGAVGAGTGLGLAGGAAVIKAENTNSAQVTGSDVHTSGATSVTAHTERDMTARAAALAAGGVGLAGTVALIQSGSSSAQGNAQVDSNGGTLGEIDRVLGQTALVDRGGSGDQTVSDKSGSVTMNADDLNLINAGSATAIRSRAIGVAPTATVASISGGEVRAGSVLVQATEANRSKGEAGSAAGGVVGFGAGVAITAIASRVEAGIVGGAQVSSGSGDVTVNAQARDLCLSATDCAPAASAAALQGSGGVIAGGAAIAHATNTATVRATVSGDADVSTAVDSALGADGALRIAASDSGSASADAKGLAAGVVAVGVVEAQARNTGLTEAALNGSGTTVTIDAGRVELDASRAGRTVATGTAGAGGVVSGAGVVATSTDDGTANARVDGTAQVKGAPGDADKTAGGRVEVLAQVTPQTKATASGISASFVGSLGLSLATAESKARADATVENANITARDLAVQARVLQGPAPSADALASSGAGGLLLGGQASLAQASALAGADARIGALPQPGEPLPDTVLSIGRHLAIESTANSSGAATASGIGSGFVGLGSSDAVVHSQQSSRAQLAAASGAAGGTLRVEAAGTDSLDANATSGAGGVVGGAAATATNLNTASTHASVDTIDVASPFNAGRIELVARHVANVDGRVDTMGAGAVGASGGALDSSVDSSVKAGFGAGAVVQAREVEVSAANEASKRDRADMNVQAGAGGVFGGSAAASITRIGLDTRAYVGEQAVVTGTGTRESPGGFRFDAHNVVSAHDAVALDAGGAIAVTDAESRIDAGSAASPLRARVEVGAGAQLHAQGDLTLGAHTEAEVFTNAYGKTYGLAGAPVGISRANVYARDEVVVAGDDAARGLAGAQLFSLGETTLTAGSGVDGAPSVLNAQARSDVYNKTAFPVVTKPVADAVAIGSAGIDVAAGGKVEAATDINLYADVPRANALGVGVGKDLYREILAAIANAFSWLFGGGHVSLDIRTGSATAVASSAVNVDGLVRAGAQNKQFLVINEDGSIARQDRGVTFKRTDENLYTTLVDEIKRYEELIQQYSAQATNPAQQSANDAAVASFRGEIERLSAQMLDLELAVAVPNPAVEVPNPANPAEVAIVPLLEAPTQQVITVGDVLARGGDIDVRGQRLTGSGALVAPNDTEINIVNRSPAYLRTNELVIPQNTGGHIRFNGIDRHSAAELGAGASFREFTTGAGSTPLINVENTYVPPDGSDNRIPELQVQGDVSNLDGKVVLTNSAQGGNIVVQFRPGTTQVANIDADVIDIAAGGDFIQGYVNGFKHVGGKAPSDPSMWGQIAADMEARRLDDTSDAKLEGRGHIIASNVVVSARWLNINGLIRAGLPDWTLTLDPLEPGQNLTAKIDAAKAKWEASGRSGDPRTVLLERDLRGGKLQAWFNAETGRIEIEPVRVSGGRMTLTGEILNTGGGKLEALDGYGSFDIVNKTAYALDIKGLDTGSGNGAEGVITLIDSGKSASTHGGGNGPLITEYRRTGSGADQVMTVSYYELNRGSDTSRDKRVQLGETEVLGSGRSVYHEAEKTWSVSYAPVTGQRYIWTTGNSETSLEFRVKQQSTIFFAGLHDTQDYNASIPIVRTPKTLLQGELTPLVKGDSQAEPYAYDFTPIITSEQFIARFGPAFRCDFGGCGFTLIDVYKTGTQNVNTHSVKADHPIGIQFIGNDRGKVSIDSHAGVVLSAAPVRNSSGDTTITSGAGRIQGESERGVVGGRNVTLTAGAGIFGATGRDPLLLDLNGGLLNASSGMGDVRLFERNGTAQYGRLEAAGTLALRTDGNVAGTQVVLAGKRIEVEAGGGVGSTAAPVSIERGEAGVSVRAVNDIALHSLRDEARGLGGDLHADRIESLTGDVTLAVGGQLIDANRNDQRDERTIEQLQGTWQRARVLDGSAEAAASLAQAKENYRSARERDYFDYWRARGLSSANPHVAFSLSASDRQSLVAAGWSTQRIDAYVAEKSATWDALRNTTYDPGYRYVLSAADDTRLDAVTLGASWTRAELTGGLSDALVNKKVTSTETRIEQPNVAGRNITVVAGRGVGSLKDTLTLRDGDVLTEASRLALLAAEPDDVGVDNAARTLTVVQRDDVDFAATGTLNVTTTRHAYLGGQADLNLDAISAGEALRIKGAGSLLSAERVTSGLAAGGNVVLEAASGRIGNAGAPLQLTVTQPGRSNVTVRAEGDINLVIGGDLPLNDVFSASGSASLVASGAITDARNRTLPNVEAVSVLLRGASIGAQGNPLDVLTHAPAAGGMAGGVHASATAGDAWLALPMADARDSTRLADISARGNVSVSAALGNMVLGNVRAGNSITMAAHGGRIDADAAIVGAQLETTAADSSLTLSAAGSIGGADQPLRTRTTRIEAASVTGSVVLSEADDLLLTARAAQTVSARVGGNATTDGIEADTLMLEAGGTADVRTAVLGSGFDIRGQAVTAQLRQADGSTAGLSGALGGPGGGQAERIEARIEASLPIKLQRLYGRTVQLGTSAPGLAVQDGWIGRADIHVPNTYLLIDTVRPRPAPADVQLFAPSARYQFSVAGNEVVTSSFVVDKRSTHTTLSPQGRDMTIVEQAPRLTVTPRPPHLAGTPWVPAPDERRVLTVGELRFEADED